MPDRPISPNRVRIAGLGSVVSLALGLGLAALAEMLNQSIRTARDMELQLNIRPIAVLPVIMTDREIRRRTWLIRAGVLLPLLVIPLLLFAIDYYFTPLSALAEQLMRRSGVEELLRLLRERLGL